MAMLNPNVETLDTPAIPLAGSWANSYQGDHGPLIDLSQAVPNYPPHQHLLADLSQAAADPRHCGYGDIEGEPLLRDVYSQYVSSFYNASIGRSDVHITAGCNQAFFATLLAAAEPGSKVLMVNPCYFNHKATTEVLGLEVGYVEGKSSNGFLPDIAAFEQAYDDSVSVVALVSPNNPTGAIYPETLLDEIFKFCQGKNIWLILDETYREFAARSESPPHRLLASDGWRDHFIQLYSFSKTFCIPGHRVGAVVADGRVIAAISKVMDNLQICAPRPAQQALAGQIEKLEGWIAENNRMIAERAAVFEGVIAASAGWEIRSMGGYFAYVEHPFGTLDSAALAKKMASQYGVLPLPGRFFGNDQDRYLRMAFANADKETLGLLEDRLAMVALDYGNATH